MTEFEKAKKRYNKMMDDFCLEYLTIGTSFSEGTEGWQIPDMVRECEWQLSCCYEYGNGNNEGASIIDFMDSYGASREEAEQIHKEWLSKTMRLRNFIKKYKGVSE